MIRDLENEDSSTNKNLEEYDNKIKSKKATSSELTADEANVNADESIMINEATNENNTKDTFQNQNNQSLQLTEESIRYQDFKQRNMEEFTNDYTISQVVPNGWSTFFNVVSTVLFTLAIFIAICIGACLIFRIQVGIVPTDSMEPVINRGSLIFYKPIAAKDISLKEVEYSNYNPKNNPNQILCYSFNGVLYVHRLDDIIQDQYSNECLYVMAGDNENLRDEDGRPTATHIIAYSQIKGEFMFSLDNVGIVVYFIQNNLILTLSIFCVFIFGIMLVRNIIERNHAREEINVFIDKKAELERQNEEKMLELQKEANKRDFERILQTNYNTPEQNDSPIKDKSQFDDIEE